MNKLSSVILNDLKCADCRSYLSHKPIRIVGNGEGICGRCHQNVKGSIHSSTFEALASLFNYPCKYRYKNCPNYVPMLQMAQHEKWCSFKPGCCLCCRHPSSVCGPKLKEDNEGARNVIADEKVLDLLRCASCSNYLSSSPIFIAPDGSDICHRCGINVHPPLTRNKPLETILNAFVFKCTYKNYGCSNLYSFGAISVHEQNCEYFLAYHKHEMRKQQQHQQHQQSFNGMFPKVHRQERPESKKEQFVADIHSRYKEMANYEDQRSEASMESKEPARKEASSPKEAKIEKKPSQKVRGVVETPRGHIYATITPNNNYIAFKPNKSNKKKKNEMEDYEDSNSGGSTPIHGLEDLQPRPSVRRNESQNYNNRGGQYSNNNNNQTLNRPYNYLVDELRYRQKIPQERY